MFTPPASIEPRIVLRIYGWLTGLGGIAVIILGPTDLTKSFGVMLVAIGCWAAALSQVADTSLRRRGLTWFATAHLVIALNVGVTWGSGTAARDQMIQFVSLVVGIILLGRIISLALANAKEPLGSRYEQQMRQAGAQEERNRLARDLHDSIKQQIFVIQTAAATAQTRFDNDREGSAVALDQIRDAARDAMTEMEVMMDNLRSVPLENASLIEALKKQCEALGHRTDAQVDFKLGELPANEALPPGSHQAIFRVAQETFANVGRHARAGNVTVSLGSTGERLELRIQDDGSGFDQSRGSGGMGIANMRARAVEFGGRLDLTSAPGAGTTVVFSLPYGRVKPRVTLTPKLLSWTMIIVVGIVGPLLGAIQGHTKGNDVYAYVFVTVLVVALARRAFAYRRRSDKAKA